MVDHTQNPNVEIDNERWLERCQGLNLEMARRLLQEESGVPDEAVRDLVHLARVIKGAEFETPAGEPYSLNMGMNEVEWYEDTRQEGRYGLLELKGLIKKESDHWGREWWSITKFGWDYFDDKFRFDLGEGWNHQRITALYRTYCLVAHAMRAEDVQVYPGLTFSEKDADLQVHAHPNDDRPYFDLPHGDSQSVYVEVVTDHHNTERVAQQRIAFALEQRADGLWIFENQKTANKFLRRLEKRDDDTGLDTGYAWSPTTPIETINERARDLMPGIDGVMTFHQLEELISGVSGWREKVSVTDPVVVQELGLGSRQMLVDSWSD